MILLVAKLVARTIRFGENNMKGRKKKSRPLWNIRTKEVSKPEVDLPCYPGEAQGQVHAAAPGHPEADHAHQLPDVFVHIGQSGEGAPAVPPAGGLAGLKVKMDTKLDIGLLLY